jgi:branched-chain amino acid transport system permease protein
MNIDLIAEFFLRALALGMTYALMGLGLTLIIGVMRVINFAQGEFYMMGAYAAFYFVVRLGIPFYFAIPLGSIIVFFIGLVVEKTLITPMRYTTEDPMEYSLIMTFGLSILLQNLIILIFGSSYYRPEYTTGMVDIFSVSLPGHWAIAMLVSAILVLSVSLYVSRSRRGRSWRALAQCLPGARIAGVNVDKESGYVFALACLLAAAAGAVLAPITLVFPTVGSSPLIKGYVILAIGGLGSIPGAFVGGLLLGFSEILGSVFISSAFRDIYGFILLVGFLLFRPLGLFGKN